MDDASAKCALDWDEFPTEVLGLLSDLDFATARVQSVSPTISRAPAPSSRSV